ncbi:NHLP leader peptide family RiPP precursor [Lignipirellula cremea]|uniref:Nitrile hydratase alpha/Thiocyanate hydrolase gamma domain-containing protein n=1 Tax=Lignipirellula cremea TaxID=2528010 RepID=A0A518DQM3_9BACT|nr:NHLP leader peptide family RiPP precursor [Lignipirellula cremea]QDU94138.1 hypothetical protein Pla8534_19250 [Lignipirellula cremea]
MAPNTDWNLKWELLVADAWDDADLKTRLLSDPMAVCKERGIVPPEGVVLKVVENDVSTIHLVLPEAPTEAELSEEELEGVAGGGGFSIGIGPGGGVSFGIGGCSGGRCSSSGCSGGRCSSSGCSGGRCSSSGCSSSGCSGGRCSSSGCSGGRGGCSGGRC